MYASTTIANTIIAKNPGRNIMGIVKLVYLAQGWSLANKDPLVSDLPQYWECGPVHVAVYDMLRGFGGRPIGAPVPLRGAFVAHVVPEDDAKTHVLLDELVRVHRQYTDIQLSNYCHEKGTPWANARAKLGFRRLLHTCIPETDLLHWFGMRLIADRLRTA